MHVILSKFCSADLILRDLLLCALVLGIAGCAPRSDLEDLRRFASDAFKDEVPKVEPLPQVEPQESFTYDAQSLTNPFLSLNLRETESLVRSTDDNAVFQPERRREPLEQFPLDAMSMVGTLFQDGHAWVLIGTPDGGMHRITQGNYLGQQNGKIIDITEQKVLLREVVKGPSGQWEERKATLTLLQ